MIDRHIRNESIHFPSTGRKSNHPVRAEKCSRFLHKSVPCERLVDDYYSHMVDWPSDLLYYCSSSRIIQYNLATDRTHVLFDSCDNLLNALKTSPKATDLAFGSSDGKLYLLDLLTNRTVFLRTNKSRIGVVEWYDENVVMFGSRDKAIKIVDLRTKNDFLAVTHHSQEVCGLKVNCDRLKLASGGNDNNLIIQDIRCLKEPMHILKDHKAAVKAISWSPNAPNLLVSGGGTMDKTIKLWNIDHNSKKNDHYISSNDSTQDINCLSTSSVSSKIVSSTQTKHRIRFAGSFNISKSGNHTKEFFLDRFLNRNIDSKINSSPFFGLRYKNYAEKTAICKKESFFERIRAYPRDIQAKFQSVGNNIGIQMNFDLTENQPLLVSNNVGAQICNLHWRSNNDIISTQGYSNHDVRIFDSKLNLKEILHGHKGRVIHFAISTDETRFVTGSTHNIFYFWDFKDRKKEYTLERI